MAGRRTVGRHGVVGVLGATVAVLALTAAGVVPATAQSSEGGGSGGEAGEAGEEEVATLGLDAVPPVPEAALSPLNQDKLAAAERARFVQVDPGDVGALGGGKVRLELLPGVTGIYEGGEVTPGAGGTTTWSGLSEDGNYTTLTFAGDQLLGTASVDGTVYDLSPTGGSTVLVTEEGREFLPEGHPPNEDDPGETDSAPAPGPRPQGSPVVDVLTWYDNSARTYYGSDTAAQADLAATINETNAAYARSGVAQSLRSVGIEAVAYTGSRGGETELNRITGTTDGVLDGVHPRRDQLGADLVAFITVVDDVCGIAWLGGPSSGALGFSVTAPSCARGGTYAHELGHNMGAGHGPPDGTGIFSYANGYRDHTNAFRTIMAYNSSSCAGGFCQRIGYFSGPVARFNGLPVGSAGFDNSRTLSERASITAGYRPTGGVTRPANDDFASAQVLSGASGTVSGTNVGATKQSGEPQHRAGDAGGRSVWYRWTAPSAGVATVETCGSSFDTVLAAYTGTAVNALSLVAANDDACGNRTDRITFNATAGTTYRVAVDGYGAATGTVSLRWNLSIPRPANDNFGRSRGLSGRSLTAQGTNVAATRQAREPVHAGRSGDTSVWFHWTAPRTARVEVNTFGSTFDTLLGVYRGPTLASLVKVKANDDVAGLRQSRVRFNATAGRTYRIAVAGYAHATGAVRLRIQPV